MLAEIQVLPRPAGTADSRYQYVDAAIAVVAASGLSYEVGALGTTVEGSPADVWSLLRAVHEATLHAGAEGCVSIIKVASAAGDSGPSIGDLVTKHRA